MWQLGWWLCQAAQPSQHGLAGVVFGLSESESHGGFTHPLVFGPILGGIALVAAFVLHALSFPRPLLDVRLFKERAYSAAAATTRAPDAKPLRTACRASCPCT